MLQVWVTQIVSLNGLSNRGIVRIVDDFSNGVRPSVLMPTISFTFASTWLVAVVLADVAGSVEIAWFSAIG
jgi:lysylphosphatidylglycerol synthetase-like protein (DUF2156 family)